MGNSNKLEYDKIFLHPPQKKEEINKLNSLLRTFLSPGCLNQINKKKKKIKQKDKTFFTYE